MGVGVVGVVGNRFITKANAAGEVLLSSVAVTGVNGTSAYGQVSASVAADTVVTKVVVVLGSGSFTLTDYSYVDVAVGAAGFESVVATVPLAVNYNAASTRVALGSIVAPCRIGAGSRLAVRITDSSIGGVTANIKPYGIAYANIEGT